MNELYARLHVANPKAAILSIIPGYSETFNSSSSLPPIMLDFAKPEYMDLEYADLLNKCEKIFCSLFVITSEQAARLERVTREQAKSGLWYSHRAGRITASKIRQAAHSPPGSPSMSLILMPHYGASPDGVTMCQCCGKGLVELKCPYSARDYTVLESALDYLEYAADSIRLKKEHSYFYQVQTQIFLCQAQFAHFAVWTPKGIHIERIEPCVEFFHGVFEEVWCYCRKPEETGKPMIGCDNPACPIEWYHMACLNMELVPREKWYCPDCEQQFKK